MPLARFRGITGTLARDNALRNPRRTASTASALLVGVAVVALFTVLGASIKASVNESVNKSFAGDLVVSTGGGGGGGGHGFSPQVATRLNQVPQVQKAAGIGFGGAKVNGSDRAVAVVNAVRSGRCSRPGHQAGNVSSLSDRQLAISDQLAKNKNWKLGTVLTMQFPDGTTSPFKVGAIYDRKRHRRATSSSGARRTRRTRRRTSISSRSSNCKPGTSLKDGQNAVENVDEGLSQASRSRTARSSAAPSPRASTRSSPSST